MNYYEVKAKCGHVGRNNYIIKCFYVYACNKKEAASITRYMPRVKHHHKDAIINVEEISYDDYLLGKKSIYCDPYFNVTNSSDQRLYCDFRDGEIIEEKKDERYRKTTHAKKRMVELLTIKDWKSGRCYIYE